MALPDRLRDLVVGILDGTDVHLYDITRHGLVVRVTVQRDGDLDLDTIAQLTRRISRALDEADPIQGSYQLEVSSPGLERVLRLEEHWHGAEGERVKIKCDRSTEGDRRIEGMVRGFVDGAAVIETPDGEVRVPFDRIERATTVFEWGPTPKPGGAKGQQERTR